MTLAVMCAVVLGGSVSCGARTAVTPATAHSSVPRSSVSLPIAAARCGEPRTPAHSIRFRAADGTELDGVLVGHAGTGVVLVHEYPADLCGFWPYATYLAAHHLEALDIDIRCFGDSACPSTAAARRRAALDVVAAAADLRNRGVTRVALLGASFGCTLALVAAPVVHPAPNAIACLSGHASFTARLAGTPVPLDATTAVRHQTSPALFVVAVDDPHVSIAETRRLVAADAGAPKALEILRGAYTGDHGWDLLGHPSNWTPLAARLAAFVQT